MEITKESIIAKLGFNPITYKYSEEKKNENAPNPFMVLSVEELNFMMKWGMEEAKKSIK